MKAWRRAGAVLPLPLLLACPGPAGGSAVQAPTLSIYNPLGNPTSRASAYRGQPAVQVFLGEGSFPTGANSKAVTWVLVGPGQLQTQAGTPLAMANDWEPAFFLPPSADDPGTSARISASYRDIYNSDHQVSLTLTLVSPTQPLQFSLSSTYRLRGAPLGAGDQDTFAATLNPMLADPSITWTLETLDPPGADPGTLTATGYPQDRYQIPWMTYTAPAALPGVQSVLVTAQVWDPWHQQTLSATWPLSLQPK